MATGSLSSRRPAASILLMAIAIIAVRWHVASGMDVGGYGSVQLADRHFLSLNPRSGSRFLLAETAKKGDQCDPESNNICSGTEAKDGTELLYCCKNHCRNVLSDRNNCGVCGNKCRFGQLCCNGKCTAVAYDVKNCGKCGEVCSPGVRCEYGACGYA